MNKKRNYMQKTDRKRIEKILSWYDAINAAQSGENKSKKEVKDHERNK